MISEMDEKIIDQYKKVYLKEMLSQLPIDFKQGTPEEIDQQILRAAMIAELDAVNLYEQFATLAKSELAKKVLLDVAHEEKVHAGEFETVLEKLDPSYEEAEEEGEEEVEDMDSEEEGEEDNVEEAIQKLQRMLGRFK